MSFVVSAGVKSVISFGSSGLPVDIECHISNSLPNIVIVGFANKTVDESKERLRGAFTNSELQLPRKRISINLAPADVPKDSSSLDLAIAISILVASKQVEEPQRDAVFIGELGLDGTIRPVRGVIGKLLSGRNHGLQQYFIPMANLEQASMVPHIKVTPVRNLRELYLHLTKAQSLQIIDTGEGLYGRKESPVRYELTDIVGQEQAKRALEIAAAGGHNVLLSGPPGTGKSMLAKAFASLLPPLTHEETLEVTHLHSLANREYDQLITKRPFRSPHHSASHVSIVGGGNASIRPGEISLAHRGVLFFDELPEFPRSTIESLRQPLEDKVIVVSRAKETVTYPANFIFVATANPCPCGYYGTTKQCECTPQQINHYRHKLSGPLLDRIDICVNVAAIEHDKLLSRTPDTAVVDAMNRRIAIARTHQAKRFQSQQKMNADMTNRDIKQLASVSPSALQLLNLAGQKLDLSARSYMRTIKVARTIADLSNSPPIEKVHITEALQYRGQTTFEA